MKIASFNVNGVNGRLSVLLKWLKEAKPDVVCFQELKAPKEKFPIGAIEKAGYSTIWHGQKSWNGVAILQRGAEPTEIRRGLPRFRDEHSRYIEAMVNGIISSQPTCQPSCGSGEAFGSSGCDAPRQFWSSLAGRR